MWPYEFSCLYIKHNISICRSSAGQRWWDSIGVRFFVIVSKLRKNKLCYSCYLAPILFGLEERRGWWAIQITLHQAVNYHLYGVSAIPLFLCVIFLLPSSSMSKQVLWTFHRLTIVIDSCITMLNILCQWLVWKAVDSLDWVISLQIIIARSIRIPRHSKGELAPTPRYRRKPHGQDACYCAAV